MTQKSKAIRKVCLYHILILLIFFFIFLDFLFEPADCRLSLLSSGIKVFNINSTLTVIFKELGKYSSLPERYFKLKYCQKEYNYMERNKKIIDIFDNENKVAIVDIVISTKIDRDIFALQEKELNEAPLERKIKYVKISL